MKKSLLERLAPLTGLISVVFVIFGAVVISNYDYLPPAERIADFINGNPTQVITGAYISLLSAFFLTWFAGSLRSALMEHEGGTGRLSTVAFGGGVAAAVALSLAFTAILSAGLRAGAEGGISPIGAVTLFDFWGQVMGQMFAMGLAVLIAASAVVSLRKKAFPAWFGWVSVLVAIGLLTPIAYIILGLAMIWLVVVSIWLYIRGAAEEKPSTTVETA